VQDEEIPGPGPDDGDDIITGRFHGPGDGVEHRHTGTAAHTDNLSDLFDVGCLAERSDHVLVPIAHLQGLEKGGGFANHLIDHGNNALFRIRVSHGQWNALAGFVGLEDNELTGFGLPGDERRLYLIKDDGALGHLLASDDFEHG
jgi:hypothetical protein